MRLLLARHLWGVDLSLGIAPHVARWRDAGYEALETSIRHQFDGAGFRHVLHEERLAWVAVVYTDMFRLGGSVDDHLQSLREQIEQCVDDAPMLINAHSGLDRWSLAEMADFFGGALELEARLGVCLCHETHRRRCLGTPWATAAVLDRFPSLKLTADLSHWVCVCERLLEDFDGLISRVARQTYHVHARVGHQQGPQVPDPRAPEWAAQLHAHEAWWQRIWMAQRERESPLSTLTPEFGPPPYLWTWPHTQVPAAGLSEVCDWMARRLADDFDARFAAPSISLT